MSYRLRKLKILELINTQVEYVNELYLVDNLNVNIELGLFYKKQLSLIDELETSVNANVFENAPYIFNIVDDLGVSINTIILEPQRINLVDDLEMSVNADIYEIQNYDIDLVDDLEMSINADVIELPIYDISLIDNLEMSINTDVYEIQNYDISLIDDLDVSINSETLRARKVISYIEPIYNEYQPPTNFEQIDSNAENFIRIKNYANGRILETMYFQGELFVVFNENLSFSYHTHFKEWAYYGDYNELADLRMELYLTMD